MERREGEVEEGEEMVKKREEGNEDLRRWSRRERGKEGEEMV